MNMSKELKTELKKISESIVELDLEDKLDLITFVIKNLSVGESMELLKKMSDSLQIPIESLMSMGSSSTTSQGNTNIDKSDSEKEEEKTIFDVKLVSIDANKKIGIIRLIKEQLNVDLMKAKELTDNTPSLLFSKIDKDKAKEIKEKFEAAGGVISLI